MLLLQLQNLILELKAIAIWKEQQTQKKETPYAKYGGSLGGGVTNPNAIAEFAGVKLENVNKDASTFNYKKLSDPNNYTLNEAAPKGTKIQWLYIC